MKLTRSVFGCLIRQEGSGSPHILLIQRKGNLDGSGYPGQWELPGGRQENGENDESTLIRRFQEETGLLVDCGTKITTIFSAPAGVVTSAPDEAIVFLCHKIGGKLLDFPTKWHTNAEWVSFAEIMYGEVRILTNPTSKGYPSRMFQMIFWGFMTHKELGG